MPAIIDYILEHTNRSQLNYIGHSMGTCIFFVMCSMLPEYNYKIRSQISLAPVAYVHHMTSTLNSLVPYANQIQVCFFFIGINNNMYTTFLFHLFRKLQIGFRMELFYHIMLPVN